MREPIKIDLSKGWTKPEEKWPIDCENPWWLSLIVAIVTFIVVAYFV